MAAVMDGWLHLLFAAAVGAGIAVGVFAGNWNAALGLGIAWVFLTLFDLADR